MAQSGYTPILIYASGTTTNVPLAANLTSSSSGAELALNYTDGKLFYKDNTGTVQTIASKAGNVNVSSLSFGTTGLTPSTATTGAVTLAGTLNVANGGTGLTTLTAGSLIYGNGTSPYSTLPLGTTNYVLTAGASAPQYVAQSTLSVGSATTATNIAGGIASQLVYQSASGTTAFVPNGTAGQFLTSNGTSAPSWSSVSTSTSHTPAHR